MDSKDRLQIPCVLWKRQDKVETEGKYARERVYLEALLERRRGPGALDSAGEGLPEGGINRGEVTSLA